MRRTLIASGLAATVLFTVGLTGAQAQTAARFPVKPVTLVVPYPAGGVADAAARLVGRRLQEAWKQEVVVENKVGAGGMLAANHVARAPADGHTILLAATGLVLQPQLVETSTYDAFRDFSAVSAIARLPLVLAVPAAQQQSSVDDFVKWSKQNPARSNLGNYGIGTPSHLFGIMFNEQSGTSLPLIPFQGSAQLVSNLIGNQISAAIVDSVTARRFGDKLSLLAVTGEKRLPEIPNVKTFKEQGYRSFEQDGWLGLLVPAATPEAVTARLAQDVRRVIASPEASTELVNLGAAPVGNAPSEFAAMMRRDADIFGRVIKDANIRLK